MSHTVLPPDGTAARPFQSSDMEARIGGFDWSSTPLGPISAWPQSLRTVVNILLSSRYAMWMAWGSELTFLFNDAYRPTLGLKDPWALGAPAARVWAEIWPDIGPRIETVLTTGKATYDEGLLLILERSGFPEETYHTFSYSPLQDDNGRTAGMLCVVTEETERLISERRVETLREVASALATTNSEDEVLQALRVHLAKNSKDLPYSLTYLYDDAGQARLDAAVGLDAGHALAPLTLEPAALAPWPAADMLQHPYPRQIAGVQDDTGAVPCGGFWSVPVNEAVVVPLKRQAQDRPAGFLAIGVNPYRRYDSSYSGFVDLLAGQIGAALANARAYEAERRRAEALAEIDRAKTTFFSNVSHELRTPLTLMLSPVEELLARDQAGSPGDRELLHLVQRNGLRLQHLVNTLLDFSRIEAGRVQAVYEPTDLAQFTADLAANFRSAMEKGGLAYRVDCDSAPTQPVYVDREMWEKIVFNLLSNALKFTFEGSVSVTLDRLEDDAALIVRDTGTGIPESELPHIFERFHRVAGAKGRSIEGTGIGLALVQELVRLHGGSIAVSSEVGRGSTFTVRVPLGTGHLPKERIQAASGLSSTAVRSDTFVQEALRWLDLGDLTVHDEAAPVAVLPSGRRHEALERVLLADDNPDMRGYTGRLLRERYEVIAVSNGAEALRSALATPPDLILSDIMMPELDGFGLLKELRAHPETRTIPVVLVSARAGEESRVEGLSSGADDYLIKPFTARELLARVAAHLSMNRRRREAEQALKESQATLQSFYESSPFLMGVVDLRETELIPVYGNRATAAFLQVDAARLQGGALRSAGVPSQIEDLWIAKYQESQESGHSVQFEYEHPTSSGKKWLSAHVNFLGIGPAGLPRFSFIGEEITSRKERDELIRKSNEELRRANADLEQFAYSASHDLQEPLRQVAIYSQLLQRRYAASLDSKASEYLGYCVEGAHRMETLIRDLLAYSQAAKTSESSTQPVDVNKIVDAVVLNLTTTIQETGAVITTAPLPTVSVHHVPLTHVIQNLLSNALKYRSAEPPRIAISAERDGGFWRFAVRDNGIGVPKRFQEQIFGIFKRLHDRKDYPGTGIGLAICQKVVERYGGRIWVDSEEGRGSTFFFTLPEARYE